jgi:peptidyl-prolyl cis-trans isomerase-like 4
MVLDDPFDDPEGMPEAPDESPKVDRSIPDDRLEDDFDAEAVQEMDEIELEKKTREQEARSRAVVLEMIGDLPDVDAKPPEESLFVCKLNPVTTDEDLEIIFSRFGKVTSCDVIRDRRTGDSLCYAFINFETKEMCEAAYFKMDNALIDDRRIHVDFSQSMHGLWKNFRKFGKKGGTEDDMAKAANAKRGGGGADWKSSNRTLEVKGGGGGSRGYQHYHNNPNDNRKSYDHVDNHYRRSRDDEDDDRERRRRKEKKRRDRSRSRSRDRKERRKEKDHHRRRDRSRSRDREDRKHSRRY